MTNTKDDTPFMYVNTQTFTCATRPLIVASFAHTPGHRVSSQLTFKEEVTQSLQSIPVMQNVSRTHKEKLPQDLLLVFCYNTGLVFLNP